MYRGNCLAQRNAYSKFYTRWPYVLVTLV